MYISNMLHFLDASGNIPKEMPSEAREMASFLALVIDAATRMNSSSGNEVRCFEEGCDGTISCELANQYEIHWKCSTCENEGRISGWQKTKWDNRKKS
jgi:hypothetical protein